MRRTDVESSTTNQAREPPAGSDRAPKTTSAMARKGSVRMAASGSAQSSAATVNGRISR
ncbi:MAG TPA: hypothetical protein VE007_03505 [Thermoanaerobaculia bacterium]|nr:hypothetical protein [Thermoanaerobaculia bacterium]